MNVLLLLCVLAWHSQLEVSDVCMLGAVEIVEVPVDVHNAALSTSPLIPSPVSPISKVTCILGGISSSMCAPV